MGAILSDGLINLLNTMNPAAQLGQLGTQLDNALAGVLPTGSISTAELADGILSADAAGRAKMAAGFVTSTELGSNAVTTVKITDANVTTAKIADEAITDAKKVVVPFVASATLTSAAAATPVDIIPTASVPTGKKIYITGMILTVNGATAWTDVTATVVTIQDKNGTPVLGLTAAKAQLTGSAILGLFSTGITLSTAVSLGTGFTATQGLTIKGDANFAAGSDIVVTVSGFIK